MVTLIRDMGAIGAGVTAPRLMLGADGHRYVVKLTSNKVGPKVLANEWLGWRLAKRLGLCVPRCEMVELPRALIARCAPLRRSGAEAGMHFGSRYIDGCEYVGRCAMRCAVNKNEVVGVMLFDHLLYNDDRTLNRKNFLARWAGRTCRIYAIDHSHLFGSGRWTEESLLRRREAADINDRRAFGWLLRHYLTRARLAPHIARIQSVTDEEVCEILDEIPPAWLSEEDKAVAYALWQSRRAQAEEVAEQLVHSAADMHRCAKRR